MRIERLMFLATSVLVALLMFSQLSFAQSPVNGTLDIIVRDPSGALVNKAQIQLLNNGKQQSLADRIFAYGVDWRIRR